MSSLIKDQKFSSEYRRIENALRRRIDAGQWSVGTMLPSRRDLAREYTVSPLTIERAITGLISDGTLRADNRRGTFVARGFVAQNDSVFRSRSTEPQLHTATVGIIGLDYSFDQWHLDQDNFWDRQIVRAMEHAFSDWDHSTIVVNRASKSSREPMPMTTALKMARADRVDAIAIICFDLAPVVLDSILAEMDLGEFPVVCILPGPLTQPIPHVFYDNHRAGYQAAQHLIHQGHQELTVFAPFAAPWVRERLSGIRMGWENAGLEESGLQIFADQERPWILEDDPSVFGYQAVRSAIQEGWVPSGAVIGINDSVAFGFLDAVAEVGKSIEDFSLLGFDDNPHARGLRMTSLRPPLELMAREAARLLLNKVRQEPSDLQVRVHAHLIPRASTRIRRAL